LIERSPFGSTEQYESKSEDTKQIKGPFSDLELDNFEILSEDPFKETYTKKTNLPET